MLTVFQEGQIAGVILTGVGYVVFQIVSVMIPRKDIQAFATRSVVFFSNWENNVSKVKIVQYLGDHRYIVLTTNGNLREVSGNHLTEIENKLDVKA